MADIAKKTKSTALITIRLSADQTWLKTCLLHVMHHAPVTCDPTDCDWEPFVVVMSKKATSTVKKTRKHQKS